MKVVTYLSCLPPNNKNIEKGEILTRFSNGIKRYGHDEVILHTGKNVIESDVALSVGWVHENSKGTPHLQLRKNIIDYQLNRNKKVLIADSNLFLYKNTDNPMHYLRYSFNGVFPNTGIYCDTDIDPERWNKLSRNLGITLKEYRSSGNHILICLQRNGGWSMGTIDVMDWLNQTINTLRQYTNRPIVIRAHPGDKSSKNYLSTKNMLKLIKLTRNIRLSKPGASLIDDLKDCWAMVNHNSSPAIGATIEGVPVFVTDPNKSQAQEVANTDLSQIENPRLFDREAWVQRLAMFHWNFEEIETGEAWAHMRKYV